MTDERHSFTPAERRRADGHERPEPSGFLAEMIAGSRRRVAAARDAGHLRRPEAGGEAGRLLAALARPSSPPRASGPRLALIAEVKRRSPSKGDIAPRLDAVAQARAYAAAGADAVSVLTEPTRFGGSLDDLRAVSQAVDLPVLRKDFIVDRRQIWEAAEAGAAAVLLIVAILSDDLLRDLMLEAADCGLDSLVEIHDGDEARRARGAGCPLVGVNNRNLVTLDVDMACTESLAPALAHDALLVSESGISTPADARRAARAGARALLVGETLVRAGSDRLPELVSSLMHPESQP